jgi:hypothetical protein
VILNLKANNITIEEILFILVAELPANGFSKKQARYFQT